VGVFFSNVLKIDFRPEGICSKYKALKSVKATFKQYFSYIVAVSFIGRSGREVMLEFYN